MAKGFYPKGQNYYEVIKQETFFEVLYWKDLVTDKPLRASVYFSTKTKMEQALSKMFKTKVSIRDILEWKLPAGFDFNKIGTNLNVMEKSKKSLLDNYIQGN